MSLVIRSIRCLRYDAHKMRELRGVFFTAVLILCSCQPKDADRQPSNRLPTATEVFELRSKCAALGEKIMEDNLIGIALAQEQLSHYSPETNRCYVKLEVHTANLATPQENYVKHDYFYDGQTKEMLATTTWSNGGKSRVAMIFSDSLKKFVHDRDLLAYSCQAPKPVRCCLMEGAVSGLASI